jgi:hypothetical protein
VEDIGERSQHIVKIIWRAVLLVTLLLVAVACGDTNTGSNQVPEVPTATVPTANEGGEVAEATQEPTATVAAAETLPTQPAVAEEPTLPTLPEVVPADPTATTPAAGAKPTLIFFSAPN